MIRSRPLFITARISARFLSSSVPRTANRISSRLSPVNVVPTCPHPTCPCAATPEGLDIDHEKDLNGLIAPYAQHVLVSTGRPDWTSRIEDDGEGTPWGDFGRNLKSTLGRGGKYSDVCMSGLQHRLQNSELHVHMFIHAQKKQCDS